MPTATGSKPNSRRKTVTICGKIEDTQRPETNHPPRPSRQRPTGKNEVIYPLTAAWPPNLCVKPFLPLWNKRLPYPNGWMHPKQTKLARLEISLLNLPPKPKWWWIIFQNQNRLAYDEFLANQLTLANIAAQQRNSTVSLFEINGAYQKNWWIPFLGTHPFQKKPLKDIDRTWGQRQDAAPVTRMWDQANHCHSPCNRGECHW